MYCFVLFWPVLFSHTFPILPEITFPMFLGWTILLMWRLMKMFYFWSHFIHTNVYVKLFTKEVNLFCSWVGPNICILDSFDIEVWKYIQYRRAGSVLRKWFICNIPMNMAIGICLENRYKWTSAEMFLWRFSTAFRTASIKNTHRWLLPKCLFAAYSESI